jgi:nicotinamide-nucleotide amidase
LARPISKLLVCVLSKLFIECSCIGSGSAPPANTIREKEPSYSCCLPMEREAMVASMEIVCVGNELLIGKILNTNAQWLSKRATILGVNVRRLTVVTDEVVEIAGVIREVLERKPRFVITTGGLGPTFDDKTLEGIAEALNQNLRVNEQALEMVKNKYKTYAREKKGEVELTPPRLKMATIPEEAAPVPNPVGTAPAVRLDVEGTTLIALPGVPREMEAIFEESIEPLLRQASGGISFHEKSIYANDIMESNLAPLIDQVMHDNPSIYIKSHPKGRENMPHMEIHLSTSAKEKEQPEETLRKAETQLSKLIVKNGGKIVAQEQTAP